MHFTGVAIAIDNIIITTLNKLLRTDLMSFSFHIIYQQRICKLDRLRFNSSLTGTDFHPPMSDTIHLNGV